MAETVSIAYLKQGSGALDRAEHAIVHGGAQRWTLFLENLDSAKEQLNLAVQSGLAKDDASQLAGHLRTQCERLKRLHESAGALYLGWRSTMTAQTGIYDSNGTAQLLTFSSSMRLEG